MSCIDVSILEVTESGQHPVSSSSSAAAANAASSDLVEGACRGMETIVLSDSEDDYQEDGVTADHADMGSFSLMPMPMLGPLPTLGPLPSLSSPNQSPLRPK